MVCLSILFYIKGEKFRNVMKIRLTKMEYGYVHAYKEEYYALYVYHDHVQSLGLEIEVEKRKMR